jgi:hypothetical protein
MTQKDLIPLTTQKLSAADMFHVSLLPGATVTHSVCDVDGTDDGDVVEG